MCHNSFNNASVNAEANMMKGEEEEREREVAKEEGVNRILRPAECTRP